MNKADKYYIDNLNRIKDEGSWDEHPRPRYSDGVIANSKFITQVFEEYDISKGEFPISTLRNVAVKIGIKEIFWIYQKQTNSLEYARDMGINWWDEWDIGDGTIGQRYGATVKKWNLINKLLYSLKYDPFSRRHIMNLYQESDLRETNGLYPCAYETLWSVRKVNGDLYLDLTLIQRSSDYLMANQINKIQYVALQMMIAEHLRYKTGKFAHLVQNLHVYDRHFEAMEEILGRTSENVQPKLEIKSGKKFYDYTIDDFSIIDNIGKKLTSKLEIAI